MIARFSSRRQRLDHAFLAQKLKGATSYKRIAGYFRSSIFELVGEEIAGIADVRIVCNSELDAADIAVSKAARDVLLKERWNAGSVEVEALLQRERYKALYELLISKRVQVRVVARETVFLHGKAGVICAADGSRTSFMGSANETRSGFANNYEIVWEDASAEAVSWVEEEFEALWAMSHPLPDAIIDEVRRVAERVEVRFDEVAVNEMPAAALVESPIYRGGEQLQPWQRAFVALALEHRERYGKMRLLLADEVGLGKTLSLAASAMVAALLDDGPVLILCPSTLTLQWQVELNDRLGIPSAVWLSNRKTWVDPQGHEIRTRGAEDVSRCPFRIAIVSTGLIVHDSVERAEILKRKFNTVVLDEAHKARRRGGLGPNAGEPNNLLDFMMRIGPRTQHLLLGTATPIQTEVSELWDLMQILNSGADFVLGQAPASLWANWQRALPFVKGEASPENERELWELLRNPLPPGEEHAYFHALREQLGLPDATFICNDGFAQLSFSAQQVVRQCWEDDFFRTNNPILRHTVLRRRETLEAAGLLDKVAVNLHPDSARFQYPALPLSGVGVMTNHPFALAYEAAGEYCKARALRDRNSGFMKTLLLQRVCSSFASGLATARKLLGRQALDDDDDENGLDRLLGQNEMSPRERELLQHMIDELSRPEAVDPKLRTVTGLLTEHRVEGKTWLEHGCIVFSQYYDTARWIAGELAARLPTEPIAVYAGVGKSGLYKGNVFTYVARDEIKAAVKRRDVRLVVATDAACEGLNLQTLGTLINVDLPWNPARLEQRLGRIKRFGQARRTVDMASLVYHDTLDEEIYAALSRRMQDKFDVLGGLPDTLQDEWLDDQRNLAEEMDKYISKRKYAHDVFESRYRSTISPDENRWELCSRVLSRKDVNERLSVPW